MNNKKEIVKKVIWYTQYTYDHPRSNKKITKTWKPIMVTPIKMNKEEIVEDCEGEPCEYGGNCPNYGHPEIWCYFKPNKGEEVDETK